MSSIARSSSMYVQMLARVCGSSPTVGSSRNSTRGECIRPRAISSRRRMPPENSCTRPSRRSHSPTISSTTRIRSSVISLDMPYSSAWKRRFCAADRYTSSVESWKTRPMLRRTSRRLATTSWPATVAVPAVGSASVHSILIVVDLPAPLGPRKPKISPGATSNEIPSTAANSP